MLDAGVPHSVGSAFDYAGHEVIYYHDVLADGAKDDLVAITAINNSAILVALDKDMKQLAKRFGVANNNDRFARLSIIRLCCNETQCANRIAQTASLIEHEWDYTTEMAARRLWIDVGSHWVRTNR